MGRGSETEIYLGENLNLITYRFCGLSYVHICTDTSTSTASFNPMLFGGSRIRVCVYVNI